MPKNFLKSKTFWLNAAAAGAQVAGVLPGGPLVQVVTLAAANTTVRYFTKESVTVLPVEDESVKRLKAYKSKFDE